MNRRQFILSSTLLTQSLTAQLSAKPRLKRKDCFFGLHFDLHPQATDTILGRDLTAAMAEDLLKKVAPDYIQYDCKGHAGYMGFASRTGTPSPGIVNDSLAIWRQATARHSVGLFIHFSGIWDSLAVKQHPEWAVVRADGTRDPNATSTFGPYVDQLMIPELREAAEKYDLDGAWIDGECWATKPDYSAAAAKAFGAPLPKNAKDPRWLEFLEFNREQFRKQVRHYVEVLHRARPGFQIASNWLYSTYVPEKPTLPVDFISGDYLGNSSISTARLEARYMGSTGLPWDLMAWGFQRGGTKLGHQHKSAVALSQEAAVVLAQGGGFQIYYPPSRAGWLDSHLVDVMAKVARFCRARQQFSHKTEPVPEIGVLVSTHSLYATSNKMFGGWGANSDPARGMIDALIDLQFSVDAIPEWKFAEVAASYKLIVIPDWPDIGAEMKAAIAAHVNGGGRVLIAGVENARLFAGELGVGLKDPSGESYVLGDEIFSHAGGGWLVVEPRAAEVIAERYPAHDATRDARPAATLTKVGKGQMAAIYGPAGSIYAWAHTPAVRQFLRRVVNKVYSPTAKVDGPPTLEIALRRKPRSLLLHIVNCTGMQVAADYVGGDFVPPVGPVKVEIKLPRAPRRVTLEPGARALAGSFANGVWRGTIARVEVHEIVNFAV